MTLEQKVRKFNVRVIMVKPYVDYFLNKRPSNQDVLEDFGDLIMMGMLDDHFVVEVTEEP